MAIPQMRGRRPMEAGSRDLGLMSLRVLPVSHCRAVTELPVSPTRDKGLLRSCWDPDPGGSAWQKLFALRLWGWLDRLWFFLRKVYIFGEAKP